MHQQEPTSNGGLFCRNGHDGSLGRYKDGRCVACSHGRQAVYARTQKGKSNQARYRMTAKRKLSTARFLNSTNGQLYRVRKGIRRRITSNSQRIAMLEEQLRAIA